MLRCTRNAASYSSRLHTDITLCLHPPLNSQLLMPFNIPMGNGPLKLVADDVCWFPCVVPLFASGVAGFVACGSAATKADVETAADVLLAWAVLVTDDTTNEGVAACCCICCAWPLALGS